MSPGRTTWWPKDAAWHRRERIVELGDKHGPSGPMVLDVLSSWAQEQRSAGVVRGGFRSLAREAFMTVDVLHGILRHAGEIGAVDELVFDADGRRFTCRVSGWDADQARGRAAIRQAERRAVHVTPERDMSRSVTLSALPNQTIEELPPVVPPAGGRQRQRAAREDWITLFSERFTDPPRARRGIAQAINEAGAADADGVRVHLARWFPSLIERGEDAA